jgi:hypothetical protein
MSSFAPRTMIAGEVCDARLLRVRFAGGSQRETSPAALTSIHLSAERKGTMGEPRSGRRRRWGNVVVRPHER